MANWISSKLKVAETLLQQIDQQAAESLGKGERKQSDDLDVITSPKSSGTLPLRDQLKKKNSSYGNGGENPLGKSIVDNKSVSDDVVRVSNRKIKLGKDADLSSKSSVKDSDWTELLNTPKQSISSKVNRPAVYGVQKDGGKVGMGLKGNGKGLRKTVRKVGYGKADKGNEIVGDGEKAGSERKFDSESSLGLGKMEGSDVVEPGRDMIGNGDGLLDSGKSITKDDSPSGENSEGASALVSRDWKRDDRHDERVGGETLGVNDRSGVVANNVLEGSKSGSQSCSDRETDSESGSSSDSGAEQEREERRQRRRQILAAKAAAKALDAIKEQENVVARLEGEKQSLEKILEEQANQAAQEASKLQSMMMEMMEATELEKQKHNHTRMEVLVRLAKLETANADLAKSLATAQWNLEVQVNHLAKLRDQVESKEVVLEEMKRKIYSVHQTRANLTSPMTSKGFEMQTEMLEAECAFTTDKIDILKEKERKLEANIDMTLKEMENSTEVEVELKRRLCLMTDHLIQKQSQVETLSSDKATLLFRIEAVTRLLNENKSLTNESDIHGSPSEDIEAATRKSTSPNLWPMLEGKIQSGRQHIGSMLRQLDSIFSAGAVFLARNPTAKIWSLVYLVSLHLWVLYILFSHSKSTEDSTSSSVLSLANINGSTSV
ncbi:unnamed protein product [Amaranthus hypochondriacus]